MLDFPQADVTIGYRGGPVVLEHPLTGAQVPRPVFEEAAYSYRPESPYRQLWREAETVVGMVAFMADGFSLIDPTMTADSFSLAAHGWLGHTEAASAAAVSLALPAFAGVWARPGARAVADLVSGVPDLAGAAVRPTGPLARQFDALGVPAARGFVPYDVVVASGEWLRAPGGTTRQLRLPNIDASLAGTRTLGYTTPNGDVFLQPGLSRGAQAATLRHEGVHSFLSVADDASLAGFRQRVGVGAYNSSAFFNAAEEILAEGIASGSLRQGIRHALNGAYVVRRGSAFETIVTPRSFAIEVGVGATGLGALGYGAYQIGSGFFEDRDP